MLNLSGGKVLIVGDLMLDRYYLSKVERISPEAPVVVAKVEETFDTLGGAGNVLKNIVSLRGKAFLVGAIGEDGEGKRVEELLKALKVDYYLLKRDVRTTTKVRVLGGKQQIIRIDFEEVKELTSSEETKVLELLRDLIGEFEVVVLSDYGKGFLTKTLCKFLIEEGKFSVIDPKGKDWEKYRGANLITPNLKELSEVVGKTLKNEDKEVEEFGKFVKKVYNFENVLITRSERGMTLLEGDKVHHIRAKEREVYDVSGAGDTVVAVLSLLKANGYSLKEACELSNVAGGIVVGKVGTSAVKLYELLREIRGKVLTLEELKVVVEELREEGKRIVFTNGCFDLLHPGHVSYLKKAKELGDVLIVGLNSDSSVRKLKGEGRPILSQKDRASLLSSLEFVDFIVIFDEETPKKLIELVKPDVLVKGGDYKPEEVVGREFAKRTVTVDYLQGYSTTNLIKKCKGLT